MKRRVCRETQTIQCRANCGGPQAGGDGDACPGPPPEGRHNGADLLRVKEALSRSGIRSDPRAEKSAGGERPPEAPGGGAYPGQSDTARRAVKKIRGPSRKRTVVEVLTHESRAIDVGQSLRSKHVVATLHRIKVQRKVPKLLFCNNGGAFCSQIVDLWAYQNGVRIDFSRPCKPTDTASVESFNGPSRKQCLNAHWFELLQEAKGLIEAWHQEYHESCPHRALYDRTPVEFTRAVGACCNSEGVDGAGNSP